jgi:hypothetical protein
LAAGTIRWPDRLTETDAIAAFSKESGGSVREVQVRVLLHGGSLLVSSRRQ